MQVSNDSWIHPFRQVLWTNTIITTIYKTSFWQIFLKTKCKHNRRPSLPVSWRGTSEIEHENGGCWKQNSIGQTNEKSKLKPTGTAEMKENSISIKSCIIFRAASNISFAWWLHCDCPLTNGLTVDRKQLIFFMYDFSFADELASYLLYLHYFLTSFETIKASSMLTLVAVTLTIFGSQYPFCCTATHSFYTEKPIFVKDQLHCLTSRQNGKT